MNVLIMTDLEGISGVDSIDQMDRSTDGYAFACRRLMADTNAAVEGAFQAGADTVYVVDGHGTGKNFIDGLLDPRAIKLTVAQFIETVQKGLVDTYVQIGAHAMPGTLNGFLDHAQSSAKWFNYRINGVCCGEIVMGPLFVGAYGIPCIMVSGDEAACAEARKFLDDDLPCAVVKQGIGRNRAKSIPLADAEALICRTVKEAIGRAKEFKPYTLPMPLTVQLELMRSDYCDEICERLDYVKRLDARTIEKTVTEIKSYTDILFSN